MFPHPQKENSSAPSQTLSLLEAGDRVDSGQGWSVGGFVPEGGAGGDLGGQLCPLTLGPGVT